MPVVWRPSRDSWASRAFARMRCVVANEVPIALWYQRDRLLRWTIVPSLRQQLQWFCVLRAIQQLLGDEPLGEALVPMPLHRALSP